MESLQIHTDSKSYPVFLGGGVISVLPNFLKTHFPLLTKVVIFTDSNVGERYLPTLESVLSEFHLYTYIIPNGEYAKTFDVYQSCLTYCLEKKLDRKSLVIAFGGGAVGDLSGFVAATFMRGIPFIQMPTTILAHDSAVGGKVAINHPLGKNMIGAFYQPEAVFYDLNFLSSLSLMERRSGFAEVIKHSLIQDEAFYQWLLANISDLTALTSEQLEYMLKKGIQIKNVIVSQDEKEKGIRAFLNFGHTLGHAIEAEAGYGKVTHGEAVLIGMLFALKLSKNLFNVSFHYEKFKDWVEKLGYKTSIPEGLNSQSLLERMKQDKKSVDGHIQFVLLKRIAKPVAVPLEDQFLLTELKQFQQD
ncbi:3-dehydroquinate synthase [Robertmurraya sp. DFI.2.37]|jgi:3-dehydroquinate synthase|uniref:3-dehydroquinate synthase n=1 Tax=Robertmurraya sp. DFI.2.37 TaxID=3031819 RepID=UPI00124860C5|nr:3-dehydroquinate synthase [Robertmurraya sp. DFI.2.37]MDF1507726.1 3-dehydroquinate synthase [Robertmurraya sp. DFI.2.37]